MIQLFPWKGTILINQIKSKFYKKKDFIPICDKIEFE